jgi:hypothetical protein
MSRDNLHGEALYLYQNPDYEGPKAKEEQEEWKGYDSSSEIFPHLGISWYDLKRLAEELGKPIVDLGASRSSLATEGVLRGVNIIPVDRAYTDKLKEAYAKVVHDGIGTNQGFMRTYVHRRFDNPDPRRQGLTPQEISVACKAAGAKAVMAEIKQLPFEDRGVAMAIAHDSVPKHSKDFDTFLTDELPEILRVADKIVRLYPMAVFKEHKVRIDSYGRQFKPRDEPGKAWVEEKMVLEEAQALYKDADAIQRITETAERLGFTFALEAGGRQKDEQPMLGVFTRKE